MFAESTTALLAALAAAVFAGLTPTRLVAFATLAASFLATAVAVPPGAATALLPTAVFAAVVLKIVRPAWSFVVPVAAGIAASGWVSIVAAQGLPVMAAWAVAGALLTTAAWLARRPGFAPALVRDEALLLLGVAGLVLAAGGEIMAGWRSAVALSGGPLEGGAPGIGAGLTAVVVAAVLAGCGWSWWKRR